MNKHLNDWMDKVEGKEVGSSNKGIAKERVRQGYDKSSSKKKELAKKIKVSHKGDIGHVVESIGAGGKVTSVKKHGTPEQLKKLGY